MALAEGHEALHLALLAGLEPWDEADWRCGEPPPIPQMTVDQVFQLMRVHQREARWKTMELEKWALRQAQDGPSAR